MLRSALDRFGGFLLRHRWAMLVASIVAGGLMTALAVRVEVDFTVQEMFAVDDPEVDYLERFHSQYGADDDTFVILVEAGDVFAPPVLKLVGQLSEKISQLEQFQTVDSLSTLTDFGQTSSGAIDTRPLFATVPADTAQVRALARRALASPLLRGRIVSADGRLTVIAARLEGAISRAGQIEQAATTVERIVAAAREKLPSGVRLAIAGVPYVRAEAVRLIKADQLRFLPLGASLTLLVLLLLYRSLHGVVVSALSIGLSTACTVGVMSLAGVPLDILSNVLPLLVMVYGVADAVHLLGRVHERMRGGAEREEAIRVAVVYLGVACLLTSGTTAVGFGSLLSSDMAILRRFGLFAAIGVMLAYVVTMVIVPLLLGLIRVDPARTARVSSLPGLERALRWIGDLVARRRRALLAGGVLVAALGVGLGSQVTVDNYLLGIYDDDAPTARATRLIERKLQGVVKLQLALQGPAGSLKDPRVLRRIRRIETWLRAQPEVTNVLSPAMFVEEIHRAVVGERRIPSSAAAVAQLLLLAEGEVGLERFVDLTYGKGRVLVLLRDVGARRYLALVERLRTHLRRQGLAELGVDARLTASSLLAYRMLNRLVIDLLISLSWALGIIALLLAITFRSPTIGLVSLIPNVIPLACGLSLMYLTGMRLEPTTVMIYCIALGIAVDDTIHFIARYREELLGGADPLTAVRTTLRTAGRAMVITSVVLIIGFSVTFTSEFPATQRFGLLGCVILAGALVTDLLVTPACMLVFRPWRGRRGSSSLEPGPQPGPGPDPAPGPQPEGR